MPKHVDFGPLGDTIHDRNKELGDLAALERLIDARKKTINAANEQALKQGPHKDLACKLHSTMCRANHTDGCGWYYEMKNDLHDWTGHAHKRYLDRSVKAIEVARQHNLDPTALVDIIDAIKEF